MFSILLSHFGEGALLTLMDAVLAAPLKPVLIMYGGGALITLLFLRYVVFAELITQRRGIIRRDKKPHLRLYPNVRRVH